MGDTTGIPARDPDRAFGRFDVVLIAMSIGTAVAVVSPAEIESVLRWPDSFFRFIALLVLSLALAAIGLVRGLYILCFRDDNFSGHA